MLIGCANRDVHVTHHTDHTHHTDQTHHTDPNVRAPVGSRCQVCYAPKMPGLLCACIKKSLEIEICVDQLVRDARIAVRRRAQDVEEKTPESGHR